MTVRKLLIHIYFSYQFVSKTYGTFKKQSANVRNVCGDPISLIDFVDTDKAFDKLSIVFGAALSSFEFYLNTTLTELNYKKL